MIYSWQTELWMATWARQDELPHALLLHGPEGVGKLAFAEHLCQAMLCESRDRGSAPCGQCDACRWFLAGSHPDFRRIEPESLARDVGEANEDDVVPAAKAAKPSTEIKINQVRALDDFLNLRSHRGARRVALVRPAEDMNPNAANALLKGLEEPPGAACFVLVSHRPSSLLATIRSRCVSLAMPVPEQAAARAWLESQGTGQAGSWLAYASGSPLRALALSQGDGGSLGQRRRALAEGNLEALAAVTSREDVEELAELLQKHALDRASATYCGRTLFGSSPKPGNGRAWLRFARQMGRDKLLASHPLNPRLFAEQMLQGMPRD
jgi:DNA polymerase-3 subunit delta'